MLTYEELDRALLRIFTGQEIYVVDDKFMLFKYPSNNKRMMANLIYDKSFKEATDGGLLSFKDLEKLIEDRDLYTEEDRDKVAKLTGKIDAQKTLLSKTTKVQANSDRIKRVIKELELQKAEIEYKKRSKLALAAENKAEEERTLFYCWAGTFNALTEERLWKTHEDLLNETNLVFKDKVLIGFLRFFAGIDTAKIRYIARHNMWRIRYITSMKLSEPLFGVPASEYTTDMLNLAYWSNYYQNIYDMMPEDRPADSVIEDDQALDAYMDSFYKERQKDSAARKSKRFTGGEMSAFDKEEVVVTKSNPLYQDIEYDKPREAQLIKEKNFIRKKAKKKFR